MWKHHFSLFRIALVISNFTPLLIIVPLFGISVGSTDYTTLLRWIGWPLLAWSIIWVELRIYWACHHKELTSLKVERWIDRKTEPIGFVFANMIPLLQTKINSTDELYLFFALIGIFFFLFWYLVLFYFSPSVILRLRYFSSAAPNIDVDYDFLLLSKRRYIKDETTINGCWLNSYIFFEYEKK